jgi:hypothetical protein
MKDFNNMPCREKAPDELLLFEPFVPMPYHSTWRELPAVEEQCFVMSQLFYGAVQKEELSCMMVIMMLDRFIPLLFAKLISSVHRKAVISITRVAGVKELHDHGHHPSCSSFDAALARGQASTTISNGGSATRLPVVLDATSQSSMMRRTETAFTAIAFALCSKTTFRLSMLNKNQTTLCPLCPGAHNSTISTRAALFTLPQCWW